MAATPTDSGSGATSSASSVSPANPDLLTIKLETLPEELIATLMLQNLGALELTSMTRYDMIDGIETIYQPIQDVSDVAKEYSPSNIVNSNPPVFIGDSGYTSVNWTSYNKDLETGKTDVKPMEYSFMKDVLGINVNQLDIGVNEIVEVEVMSFDPGWTNYTDKSTLLSNNEYVTAYHGKDGTAQTSTVSPEWSTRGVESFANVNIRTLSDENKITLSEMQDGTVSIQGFPDTNNHYYRPQHIVSVDVDEYKTWEESYLT